MEVVTRKEEVGGQPRLRKALLARLSESALLELARRKDVGAFEELVGRTEDRLFRLATWYVGNESDVQEILQTSYLSAWLNLVSFEGRARFGSWTHRVAVNASLMLLRVLAVGLLILTTCSGGSGATHDQLLRHRGHGKWGRRGRGQVTFAVPSTAPDSLFYDCSVHAAMSGTIHIVD